MSFAVMRLNKRIWATGSLRDLRAKRTTCTCTPAGSLIQVFKSLSTSVAHESLTKPSTTTLWLRIQVGIDIKEGLAYLGLLHLGVEAMRGRWRLRSAFFSRCLIVVLPSVSSDELEVFLFAETTAVTM